MDDIRIRDCTTHGTTQGIKTQRTTKRRQVLQGWFGFFSGFGLAPFIISPGYYWPITTGCLLVALILLLELHRAR